MRHAIMRPSRSLVRAGGGTLRNNLDQRIRRSSLDRDRSFSTSARISASLALFMGGLGCSKDSESSSRSPAGRGLTRTGDHAALRPALRPDDAIHALAVQLLGDE